MNFYRNVSFWSFTVLLFIGLHSSSGARGGGSRGGSSRSGSSRSSRSSSTSRSSVRFGTRSSYGGPRYSSGSWRSSGAYGTLWGISSYQRRRLYSSHPDKEPSICFNEDDLRNGTYGYFICPEEGQPDDYNNCCGDEDSQECCPFSLSPAAIAGIVIGAVIGLSVIIYVVFWIISKLKCRCSDKQRDTFISESAFRGRRIERYSVIHTTPTQINTDPQDSKASLPTSNTADDSASTHFSANEDPPTGEFTKPRNDNYSANESPSYKTDDFTQPTGEKYLANEAPPYPTDECTQPKGESYLVNEAPPCSTGAFTQLTVYNHSANEYKTYPSDEFKKSTGPDSAPPVDPPPYSSLN